MEKIIQILKDEKTNLEKLLAKRQTQQKAEGAIQRLYLEIEGLDHACDVLCDWWQNATTGERQSIIPDVTRRFKSGSKIAVMDDDISKNNDGKTYTILRRFGNLAILWFRYKRRFELRLLRIDKHILLLNGG